MLSGIAVVAALGARIGWTAAVLPAFVFFGAVGTLLAFIDVRTRRLPNALLLPAYPIAGALLTVTSAIDASWTPMLRSVLGASVLSLFYLGLAMAVPGGLGFGDLKFAGLIGAYLGWRGWHTMGIGATLGFLLAAVFASLLLAMHRVHRTSRLPFGPFMFVGAVVAILLPTR